MINDFPANHSDLRADIDSPSLPNLSQPLETILSSGKSFQVDGTNVVRVPFGIRHARKKRPARPERWATLVLPLQPFDSPNPPPQAA